MGIPTGRKARLLGAALLLAAMMGMRGNPAQAQDLGFEAQIEYHLTQRKLRDGTLISDGNGSFAPRYNLTFRRLLLPGARIVGDLSLVGSDYTGEFGSQQSNDLRLSLYAQEEKYNLLLAASRSSYRASFDRGGSVSGSNRNYSFSALLRPPNYPALSIQ